MDIPESVVTASGAGSQCGELLAARRGKLARDRVYPPERDVSGEEPRVGVYRVSLRRQHRPSGGCPFRRSSTPRPCPTSSTPKRASSSAPPTAAQQTGDIDQGERPQPRGRRGLHPEDARAAVPRHAARSGNQSVLLRHGEHPGALLLGSLQGEGEGHPEGQGHRPDVGGAGLPCWSRLQEFELPVNKTALVVGGGLAGMTSALSIANQGFEVYLVEKDADLGGMARQDPLHPGGAGCSGLPERSRCARSTSTR